MLAKFNHHFNMFAMFVMFVMFVMFCYVLLFLLTSEAILTGCGHQTAGCLAGAIKLTSGASLTGALLKQPNWLRRAKRVQQVQPPNSQVPDERSESDGVQPPNSLWV